MSPSPRRRSPSPKRRSPSRTRRSKKKQPNKHRGGRAGYRIQKHDWKKLQREQNETFSEVDKVFREAIEREKEKRGKQRSRGNRLFKFQRKGIFFPSRSQRKSKHKKRSKR